MNALEVDPGAWIPVTCTDDRLRALYLRHYSAAKNRSGRVSQTTGNRLRFVGPGEYLALLTPAADAGFVWRKIAFRRDDQHGVECSIFRNEGPTRSSDLIRAAMGLAWQRWPGERLFTYVDGAHVRSTNPGFCFRAAGWRNAGVSARGLVLMDVEP